ncbi:MAG TPA: GGDEF domain-containing protein [Azospirillaceae bacterium]|nr:GGDEF domain-containing protein [Azospirillaceae bacterium]
MIIGLPRFDAHDEARFVAWRTEGVRRVVAGPIAVGALALFGFTGWDWALDPGAVLWTLLVRLAGALVMLACAWRMMRDPASPIFPLSVLSLTAGTGAIAVTQAVVENGFAYGTAGLALFPTVSAVAAVRARDIPLLNLAPAASVGVMLAVDGTHGFVLFNSLAFLATGIFSAYILALGLERSYREAFRLELSLEAEARRDALTGAANRRRFEEQAATEVERARRFRRPLSLLLLDLDHFKRVNDDHGHQTGDAVLRAVAEICGRSMRQTDLFARLGGEEFVALLPETGPDDAVALAERLRRTLAETPIAAPGTAPLTVTTSIGVAAYRGGEATWQQMLAEADLALYAAKRRGRDRVVAADGLEAVAAMR